MTLNPVSRRIAIFAVVAAFVIAITISRAEAGLKFQSLQIPEGEMRLMDLDADGLNDIVLFSYEGMYIFWHHPGEGFRSTRDVFMRGAGFSSDSRQDFTIADINGDGLLDVFQAGNGVVSVYFQSKPRELSAVPSQTIKLAEGNWLVDLGNTNESKSLEILTMSPEGVFARSLGDDGSFGAPALVFSTTLFLDKVGSHLFARRQWPCPWNFCMDANGDGLDDVFIPDLSCIHLRLQTKTGKFEKNLQLLMPVIVEVSPGPIGRESLKSLGSNRAPYLWTGLQVPSIECRDINNDGKTDIVLAEVFGYLQDDLGGFPENDNCPAERLPLADRRDVSVIEQVNDYLDVNGDGLPDRVSQYRPWSTGAMKSDVKIYFGDGKRNLYAIDPDSELPDNKIVGENFLFEAQLVDLDGDGALDIMMFDTDYKITEVANWVQINKGRIKGEVKVYFFDKGKNYCPNKWGFSKPLEVSYEIKTFEIFQNRIFDYVQTMMSVNYDFTGDGKKDLMVREESTSSEDWLFIYENTGRRGDIFTERPVAKLQTPKFHYYKIMDVNSDGINDFVLYNSSEQRVGILLSYKTTGL